MLDSSILLSSNLQNIQWTNNWFLTIHGSVYNRRCFRTFALSHGLMCAMNFGLFFQRSPGETLQRTKTRSLYTLQCAGSCFLTLGLSVLSWKSGSVFVFCSHEVEANEGFLSGSTEYGVHVVEFTGLDLKFRCGSNTVCTEGGGRPSPGKWQQYGHGYRQKHQSRQTLLIGNVYRAKNGLAITGRGRILPRFRVRYP